MTIRIRTSLWGGPPGPRPAPRPARGTDAFVCQPGDLSDCSPDRLSSHDPQPAPSAVELPKPSAAGFSDPRPIPFAPRRPRSFGLSLCIHSAVVALLALSSATQPATPRPLYDQEIHPYEHKVIWYSLKNHTPDVRPTEAK